MRLHQVKNLKKMIHFYPSCRKTYNKQTLFLGIQTFLNNNPSVVTQKPSQKLKLKRSDTSNGINEEGFNSEVDETYNNTQASISYRDTSIGYNNSSIGYNNTQPSLGYSNDNEGIETGRSQSTSYLSHN